MEPLIFSAGEPERLMWMDAGWLQIQQLMTRALAATVRGLHHRHNLVIQLACRGVLWHQALPEDGRRILFFHQTMKCWHASRRRRAAICILIKNNMKIVHRMDLIVKKLTIKMATPVPPRASLHHSRKMTIQAPHNPIFVARLC